MQTARADSRFVSFRIKTKRGVGAVREAYPIIGTQVAIMRGETRCVIDEPLDFLLLMHDIPAGTPIVRNDELAKRTAGDVTHEVVEGGIYHLFRMLQHVGKRSQSEIKDMGEYRQDILNVGQYLLHCGLDDLHEAQVREAMGELRRAFGPRKRNERKVTAGVRLKTAAKLHATGKPSKNAPSALATFGAAQHLVHREQELAGISQHFNKGVLEVFRLIEQARVSLTSLWSFLGEEEGETDSVPRLTSVARDLVTWPKLVARLQNKKAYVQLLQRLARHRRDMGSLWFQPFTTLLGSRACGLLDAATRAALYGDGKELENARQALIRLVRRARMVSYIEMEIVPVASFYRERRRAKRVRYDDPAPVAFQHRLSVFRKRVDDLTDSQIDPALKRDVCQLLSRAEFARVSGRYYHAVVYLKRVSAALAHARET